MSYNNKYKKGGFKSYGKKPWAKAPVEKEIIDFSEVESQLTEYHKDVRESVLNGKNTIISAGPGTGKTWTISRVVIPALEKSGKTKGMVFAFTNKNAGDFEKCISSPEIQTGTYHALLGRIVARELNSRRNLPDKKNLKQYPGKTVEMAREIFEGENPKVLNQIADLVNKAKMAAFGIPGNPSISDRQAWEKLAERFSINTGGEFGGEFGEENEDGNVGIDIIEAAQKLMVETIKNKREIDFADMPYFVIYYDLPLEELDFVIMDEAQDIPKILLEFLAKYNEKGAQIIAVGDEKQAINGFAGGMDYAIRSIIERVNGDKKDLKESFRVSIAAAELCNRVFPDSVIPWKGAKEGGVENISWEQFQDLIPEMEDGDVILSRTHRNLIPIATEYIRKGREFVYKGISVWVDKARKSLFMATRKANSTDFFAITIAMDDFLREKEEQNSGKSKMPAWLTELQENVSILNELIQGIQNNGGDYKTLLKYLDILDAADNNKKGLPVFSTIHASKGGEWPRVYIIGSCISPLAKSEIEKDAETCVEFVAYSRSSDRLIFIPENGK